MNKINSLGGDTNRVRRFLEQRAAAADAVVRQARQVAIAKGLQEKEAARLSKYVDRSEELHSAHVETRAILDRLS